MWAPENAAQIPWPYASGYLGALYRQCGLQRFEVPGTALVVMQCGSWVQEGDCSCDIELVIQVLVLVEPAGSLI